RGELQGVADSEVASIVHADGGVVLRLVAPGDRDVIGNPATVGSEHAGVDVGVRLEKGRYPGHYEVAPGVHGDSRMKLVLAVPGDEDLGTRLVSRGIEALGMDVAVGGCFVHGPGDHRP